MRIGIYHCQLVRESTVTFKQRKIDSSRAACEAVVDLMRDILQNAPSENFCIITLCTKLKPIGIHKITVGTLDATVVHPREVFRPAILDNASCVLLVHNHPSGDLTPSRQDREVTDRLKKVGETLGITVVDHIICGYDDERGVFHALSLAES